MRAKSGDEEALSWLFKTFAEIVYNRARCAGLQDNDAQDVVQDVFVSLVKKIDDFRRDRPGDTFGGWLNRIAQNKINDYFRRRGKSPPAVGGSTAHWNWNQLADALNASDDSQDVFNEQKIIVRRVLQRVQTEFESTTWQAFWRTTVDNQKAADVADELCMTRAAVYQAKSRVLRRVREELRGLTDL